MLLCRPQLSRTIGLYSAPTLHQLITRHTRGVTMKIEKSQFDYSPDFALALEEVLKIDPSLCEVAEKEAFASFLNDADQPPSFEYIVRGIMSQQLSGFAADAIRRKFEALFDNTFPTPEQVLNTPDEKLREVGFSSRKTEYVQILANSYKNGTLSDEILLNSSDDEVVDLLVSHKGLGPWTAQMFLLFYLRRPDVFSPHDIGVQRGFKQYMKREGCEDIKATTNKDVDPDDIRPPGKSKKSQGKAPLAPELLHMEAVMSKFKPYRSAIQMILWRLSDISLSVERSSKDFDKKSTKVKKEIRDAELEESTIEFLEQPVKPAPKRPLKSRKQSDLPADTLAVSPVATPKRKRKVAT